MASTRRKFLATSGAAAATLLIPGSLTTRTRAAAATSGSAYWCVSDTYNLDSNWASMIGGVEQKVGRTFAGVRMNGGFTRPTDWPELTKDVDAGRRWVYINGKPSGTATGYWKAVAAGKYDAAFHTFIAKVMGDPTYSTARPVHYSFHHEQSVSSEGGGSQAGTAADYAKAWNHVMGLVYAANAHVSQGGKFLCCWVPIWLQVSRDPAFRTTSTNPSSAVAPLIASKILAGGLDLSKLDLVGADIYNGSASHYTPDDQWTPLHRLALQIGKPFITGETGIGGTDSFVVAYLKKLDGMFKTWGAGSGAGQVHALCWTNRVASAPVGDYRMDSTPAKLAQYKAMANDPFYSATL